MRVDRGVPPFGKFLQASDVIEMPVREDDRGGAGAGTETMLHRVQQKTGAAKDAGVDQDPLPIARLRPTEIDHVHHGEPLVGQVGRNLVRHIVVRGSQRARRKVRAIRGVEWDLCIHRWLEELVVSPASTLQMQVEAADGRKGRLYDHIGWFEGLRVRNGAHANVRFALPPACSHPD